MMQTAMIVDDEPFARDDLRHMLLAHPDVNVVCEAGTIKEALRHLAHHRPDVIFLDIQLRGGSGFDLVPYIDLNTKIIFVTAYTKYAVRAFRVNALDYILKPVSEERLAESVSRLSGRKQPAIRNPNPSHPLTADDRVYIKTDSCRCFVPVRHITVIRSIGGNYVTVETKQTGNLTCRKSFKEWEAMLPGAMFVRIHRSAIINFSLVERFEQVKNSAGKVFLMGRNEPLAVSIRNTAVLKKKMA